MRVQVSPLVHLWMFTNIFTLCQGKGSLTLVIDNTLSMAREITQIHKSAVDIANAVFAVKTQIQNMLLVTFTDTGSKLEVETNDLNIFQKSLYNMYGHDGLDCREASMNATLLALQRSLPKSFIFVFTDASAKDKDISQEIINLCQEKQIATYFVVTGACSNDPQDPTFRVYYDIATACSGLTIVVQEDELSTVIKTIRETISGYNAAIARRIIPPNTEMDVPFVIDDQIENALVTVSGTGVSLRIKGPDPRLEQKYIIWLKNVKTIKLINPVPGNYIATVNGRDEMTVSIVGRTDFLFTHGFSELQPTNINDTKPQPIASTVVHLSIAVTDPKYTVKITSAQILDINERPLSRLMPLIEVSKDFYVTPLFVTPLSSFKVAVEGITINSGMHIRRINNFIITPRQYLKIPPKLQKPIVTIDEGDHIVVEYNKTVKLTCSVSAYPEPRITWKNIHGKTLTSESAKMEPPYWFVSYITIPAIKNHTYSCNADNIQGSANKIIKVIVKDPFEVVTAIKGTTEVEYGTKGKLVCDIKSPFDMHIDWYYTNNKTGTRKKLTSSYKYIISGDGKVLNINGMDQNLVGTYSCNASLTKDPTEFVTFSTQVTIGGFRFPKIKSSSLSTYTSVEDKDGQLRIPCSATGLPPPVITWKVNDLTITQSDKYSIEDGALVINNPKVSDSAMYICEATNDAGSDDVTFQANVYQIPKSSKEASKTAIAGSSVDIECKISYGVPKPTISWQFMAADASKFVSLAGSDSVLRISSVDEKHAGRYKCVAHNVAGDAQHDTTLIVQVPPFITSKSAAIYKSVEDRDIELRIPCSATGLPKPVITWKVNDEVISPNHKYSIEEGALVINQPKVSDSATYMCEATNVAGSVNITFEANVFQIPKSSKESTKTAIAGSSVDIECKIAYGVPRPTISWQFMGADASKFESVAGSDHVLRISSVNEKHAGLYMCVANNNAGDAEHKTTLTVLVPPKVIKSPLIVKAIEDKDVQLRIPCSATGHPKPVIAWKKNIVTISPNHKYSIEDGALVINNPTVSDSATYRCEATNDAGSVDVSYQANVFRIPKSTKETSKTAIAGSSVDIECKISYGVPKPTISWQFMAADASKFVSLAGTDSVLPISSVDEKHAGRYKCVAHNVAGDAQHDTNLIVQVPPIITSKSGAIYKSVEDRDIELRIPCSATGLPKPVITWKVNDEVISPNHKYSIEEGALVIHQPKVSDSATYMCEATNVAGSVNITFEANVLQIPKSSKESTKTAIAGSSVDIECKIAYGVPRPTISWQFMGADASKFESVAGSDHVLRISSVNEKHAGLYMCVANNNAGDAEHKTTLTVLVPPKVIKSPLVVKAIEDKDVQLRIPCSATGRPKPVITWKKNIVIISPNHKYSIEDGALVINNPKVSDSATYRCEATNDAGSDTTTIQANVFRIPKSSKETSKTAVVGSSVDIECKISYGVPKPTISWQFMAADASKFASLAGSDSVLQISSVDEKHAGRYKCVAHNVAGDAQHDTTLIVQVPPIITSKSGAIYKSVEDRDIELRIPCSATGLPKPVITWKVNDEVISPNHKYSIEKGALVINQPKVSDSATYMCEATNVAGSVNITFEANVLQIPKSSKESTKTAIAGSSVDIECKIAYGVPRPTISWQFMGADASKFESVAGSDHVLRISSVNEKHAGLYMCVANNNAGDAEDKTTLTVLVPPKVIKSPLVVKAIEDKDVQLRIPCSATGRPKPVITWKKNIVIISPNHKYSIEDGALVINNPKVSDSATYRCEATNDAGSDTTTIQANVFRTPKSSKETSKTAIVGSLVDIECKISYGVPKPTISWQFMAADASKFVSLAGSDSVLQILSVDEKHAGRYKCVAHNVAGDAQHDTTLIVQVPPIITSKSGAIYKSVEDRDIELRIPCSATGLPKPVITWKVNDEVISPNHKYSIEEGALVINNPKVSDSATYRCKATNDAGSVNVTFQAYVFQIPKSSKESTKTAKAGSSVDIECKIAYGVPRPTISWQFMGADASKFESVAGSDHVLRISSVNEKHAGLYMCIANNNAGDAEHKTTLTVLVPPKVIKSPLVVKAIEDKDVQLRIPCSVTGRPKPVITWKKNIVTISPNHKYSIEDGALVINNPKVSDSAMYRCEATNDAGSVTTTIQANVLQIPSLSGDATKIAVNGSSVNIECKIFKGVPRPIISWKFMAADESKFMSMAGSDSVLRISSVVEKHAGRYKCVAHNVAGDAQHDTTLTVQVPPIITSKTAATYKSVEDRDIELRIPCSATGLPKPVITWKVNDEVISPSRKYSIEDGALVINNPKVSDSATYRCEATNDAGSVDVTFQANVFRKPKSSKNTSKTAIVGSSVDIECKISYGVPKPTISWQFMGADASKFVSVAGSDSVLRISSVDKKHAGRYKCVAYNVAGDAQHETTLIVQVPPTITSNSAATYKSVEDRDIELRIPCSATGLPKPVITWKVNGEVISPNHKYSIEDGALIINNPKVSDSGTYRCEATNDVGSDDVTFQANVFQAPKILGENERTIQSGASVGIECKIVKGVPAPTISWEYKRSKDLHFRPLLETTNVLHIPDVESLYTGSYKCIAHNEAGTAEHVTTLVVQYAPKIISQKNNTYVGLEGDVALRIPCESVGAPTPVVTWKTNGTVITRNTHYSVVKGALIIKNPKSDINVTCEAKNSLGSDNATFSVKIETQLNDYGNVKQLSVLRGTTKKLDCDANESTQSIRWFKEGSELNWSKNYYIIENTDLPSEGNYSCRVSDLSGAHTNTFAVEIGYPPHFTFDQDSTVFDWQGTDNEYDKLDCGYDSNPLADVVWTYNDKEINDEHSTMLAVSGRWGLYTCNVSNVHGWIQRSFNVTSSLCHIKRQPNNYLTMPLILNVDSTWPVLDFTNDYLQVSPGQSLIFSCPSQGTENALKFFPIMNEITAKCDKEDIFTVDGKPYKVSDFHCAHKIDSTVINTQEKCLNEDSQLLRVGYNVNGFLETYGVCFDTSKNIPLYTRELMSTSKNGLNVPHNWYKYSDITVGKFDGAYTCAKEKSSCCYGKRQLVSALDMSDGPAQRSTDIDPLNAVPYWRPCNGTKDPWANIENKARLQLYKYPDFVAWSGIHKLQEKNGQLIPRYLWKLLSISEFQFDDESQIAVVYINDPVPTEEDILCPNVCGSESGLWMSDLDERTYCCEVNDFLQAFGLRNTTVGESTKAALAKIHSN